MITLELLERVCLLSKRANETNSEAKQFSVKNRDVLMNVQFTIKVCCVQLELVIPSAYWCGAGLVCDSVGKADLLSDLCIVFQCKQYISCIVSCGNKLGDTCIDNFELKQSKKSVDLPLTCHPAPSCHLFAFGSTEVRRILLDMNPIIHCFLGEAFGVSSCPFWSTLLQDGAWLQIYTLKYWTV